MEFLTNGLCKDHEILHTSLGQSAFQTCLMDITCWFRSAFTEARKPAENTPSDGFVCMQSYNAVSKVSSNLSSEENRERCQINGVAFRLDPPYGRLLVSTLKLQHLHVLKCEQWISDVQLSVMQTVSQPNNGTG